MPPRRARQPSRFVAAALLALVCAGPAAQPLDAGGEAGRRIYLDAVMPSGEPLRGLVGAGQTPLSGAPLACGNCHGPDGKGRPEATVVPPDITWENLSKPYGHQHSNRRHDAFTESNLGAALNEGLDPSGNRIDWTMPRYSLSRREIAALVAYLKRLSAQSDPGMTDTAVRIGAILPERGPLAPGAAAVRAALAAYFATLNRAGGIHQRRLELIVVKDLEAAREHFAAEPVFALVSPFVYEVEAAFGRMIGKAKLPTIGFFSANPQRVEDLSGLAFQVLPGATEQAAALVEFAARAAKTSGWRAAIVGSGASPHREAAEAASRRCEKRGCGEVVRIASYTGPLDAQAAARRLRAERREQIFFFGSEEELGALLRAAGEEWRPRVYAPGALARAALAARARFGGEVFLVYPNSPRGRGGSLAALRREFGLDAHYQAAQRSALAAAAVLAEGLRRAGRDLSRERLLRSLETLSRFDPGGFAPPVSYGPGRRVGASGGYIVAIERGQGLVPASDWVPVE